MTKLDSYCLLALFLILTLGGIFVGSNRTRNDMVQTQQCLAECKRLMNNWDGQLDKQKSFQSKKNGYTTHISYDKTGDVIKSTDEYLYFRKDLAVKEYFIKVLDVDNNLDENKKLLEHLQVDDTLVRVYGDDVKLLENKDNLWFSRKEVDLTTEPTLIIKKNNNYVCFKIIKYVQGYKVGNCELIIDKGSVLFSSTDKNTKVYWGTLPQGEQTDRMSDKIYLDSSPNFARVDWNKKVGEDYKVHLVVMRGNNKMIDKFEKHFVKQ